MAEFLVHGAFDVQLDTKKSGAVFINQESLSDLAKQHDSFSKIGCYVFARKASRGSTPIYVGCTKKQSILKEAFNPNNRNLVMKWLNDQTQRKLQIWTITQIGKGHPHLSAIDEIETILIHWAKLENPDLLNKHKTKVPKWSIRGVERGGKGKRSEIVIEFRKMMGLD